MIDIESRNEYLLDRINRAARLFQILDDVMVDTKDYKAGKHNIAFDVWVDCVNALLEDPRPDAPDDFLTLKRVEIMQICKLLSMRGERLE